MRFQVIPSTLAENAGLNPIATVTDLRNKHALGFASAGINVRKGSISNMMEEGVSQPLLVTISAITLATETVRSILKIDDIVSLSLHKNHSKYMGMKKHAKIARVPRLLKLT